MNDLVLIAGATGYVGGELLVKLLDAGYRVRCLARRPEVLRAKALPGLEVVEGDVLNPESVRAAMAGVSSTYYLVHSMGSTQSFEEQDRKGAQNFANAARDAGVHRIIYLGGLGRSADQLSDHLRSRQEVGQILRSSGISVIEFRASVVIGSGSLSFEMIRALVERLPVMIAPRWVSVEAQPIAIADLLAYLLAALHHPMNTSEIYEIGGSDRVSYGGLMREYARQRGLKRLVLSVPFLTPRLSSLWLGLVTPLYVRVGRKLIDSIRHSTVVEDMKAMAEFSIRPCGFREAISAAINSDTKYLKTDSRTIHVNASQADAFVAIRRIGGASGWYYANWLWQLRGWMDTLVGGVGMKRGRRDPDSLSVGDVLDCWRVQAIEPDRLLRLVAEMKLPGRAVLEFEVIGKVNGSVIRQTASFDPRGILGRAYWYSVMPFHYFVFRGMLQGIAAKVGMKG
ncbi:MAG: SDR family oxidoreductase [Acidobacteriota bacterium]|nr:SDR family oxidoreductase [Acidobacteriota bacterium]